MDAQPLREQPDIRVERPKSIAPDMPDALEIDFSSANAAGLLRALAKRHGEPIAVAARSMARLFLLRAPWAPGLRFAGGTVRTTVAADAAPTCSDKVDETLSVAGSGETIEDALASCIGEAVERLSQFQRPGDIVAIATASDVSARLPPAIRQRVRQLCVEVGHNEQRTFAWIEARSGPTLEACLVPADWCLRSLSDAALRVPGSALSTGVAAGKSFEAAAVRALLELVERDAAALWCIGGRRASAPTVDAAATGAAHALLRSLRQHHRDRLCWVLDLTTDLGIPVMVAISANKDGGGFVCGFGARFDASEAVRAAILEMCQMELGLNIAVAREAMAAGESASDDDRARLDLARSIDVNRCTLLHPVGAVGVADPGIASLEESEVLSAALRHFDERGVEVTLVELSRPEFGIPVVAAIAPALQLLPSNWMTDRLQAEIASTGGSSYFKERPPLF